MLDRGWLVRRALLVADVLGLCLAFGGVELVFVPGGHYNREGHPHALPDKKERHAGDLGNLQADAQGKATLDLTVDNITINGSKNPLVGRGVIVHEKKDDGSQPVGSAGGRISCGAIGLAK